MFMSMSVPNLVRKFQIHQLRYCVQDAINTASVDLGGEISGTAGRAHVEAGELGALVMPLLASSRGATTKFALLSVRTIGLGEGLILTINAQVDLAICRRHDQNKEEPIYHEKNHRIESDEAGRVFVMYGRFHGSRTNRPSLERFPSCS